MPLREFSNEAKVSSRRANRDRRSSVFGVPRSALATALGDAAQWGVLAAENPGSTNDLSAPKRRWAASLRWKNDTFGGSYRFYTDAISLAVSHTGPGWQDPIANWFPWGEGRHTAGYDTAQAMFTPSDQNVSPPDSSDRPYAGVLAVGLLTLHVEKFRFCHGLKFVTAVVGPWFGAEQTQKRSA